MRHFLKEEKIKENDKKIENISSLCKIWYRDIFHIYTIFPPSQGKTEAAASRQNKKLSHISSE